MSKEETEETMTQWRISKRMISKGSSRRRRRTRKERERERNGYATRCAGVSVIALCVLSVWTHVHVNTNGTTTTMIQSRRLEFDDDSFGEDGNGGNFHSRSCDDVYDVPVNQRCAFARDCDDGEGFPLAPSFFCPPNHSHSGSVSGSVGWWWILWTASSLPLVAYLVVLFRLLGSTAEDCFSPALEFASYRLGLPPRFAGVTLLALGNGAPDVSATVHGVTSGHADLALGALTGAGMFVGTVALSTVVRHANNNSNNSNSNSNNNSNNNNKGIRVRGAMVRDVVAYSLALLTVRLRFRRGEIHARETAALFLLTYTLFVATVLVADLYHRRVVLPRIQAHLELRRRAQGMQHQNNYITNSNNTYNNNNDDEEEVSFAPVDEDPIPLGSNVSFATINSNQSIHSSTSNQNNALDPSPLLAPYNDNDNNNDNIEDVDVDVAEDISVIAESKQKFAALDNLVTALSNYDSDPNGPLDKIMKSARGWTVSTNHNHNNDNNNNTAASTTLEENDHIKDDDDDDENEDVPLRGLLSSKPKAQATFHNDNDTEAHYVAMEDMDDHDNDNNNNNNNNDDNGGFPRLYSNNRYSVSWQDAYMENKHEFLAYMKDQYCDPFFGETNNNDNDDQGEEESEPRMIELVLLCMELPVLLARNLTIPIPTEGYYRRSLVALSCIFSPLWLSFYLSNQQGLVKVGRNPWYLAFAFLMVLTGIGVARYGPTSHTTTTTLPTPLAAPLALYGFAVAATWIDVLSDCLVDLLRFAGIVLHIPAAVMGLTVLAWGNCVGDLSVTATLSQRGLSNMAVTAIFAGQMFNVLVGLGVGLWAASPSSTSTSTSTSTSSRTTTTVRFPAAAAVGTDFLWIHGTLLLVLGVYVWNGYIHRTLYPYGAIALYVAYLITAVTVELRGD